MSADNPYLTSCQVHPKREDDMKDLIPRLTPFVPYILAFAVLFAIFGFLLGFLYVEYEQEVVQRVNDQGLSILNQVDTEIQNLFIKYMQSLQAFSTIPAVISNEKEGKNLLEFYYELNKDEVSAVTRLDRNGTILYTIPDQPAVVGTNIAYQSHVHDLLENQKPVLSDIFTAVQGYQALAYHHPIFRNETFDGSIGILIPFSVLFEKKLSQVELSKEGRAWLISGDGTILYSPFKEDLGKKISEQYNRTPSVVETLEHIKGEPRGSHTFFIPHSVLSPFEPGLYDVVHKPVTLFNSSWQLFIVTPRIEVVSGMQGFLSSMLLIIISFAIIISLFIILLTRQQNQIRNKQAEISLEQAISQERAQLVSVLESIESLVYVIDPENFSIIYANPTTKVYFGEDIIGKHCYTVFLNADSPCTSCQDKKTLVNDEPVTREVYLPSINRHFQAMSKRISWQSGGDKVLSVMDDITEEKELDEMIHRARDKLVVLNSLTGNEIINQIFVLAGYLEVALDVDSDGDRTVYLKKCRDSLKKVEELVNFLKTYQGLGQGHPRWQNVNEVFLMSLSHLSSGALSHDIETGSLQIYSDPLLELAFEQLIKNTLIHGGDVSSISLSVENNPSGPGIILTYADNGRGIPPEHKEKIFDKGFGTGTGPGLGLFLVREILSITGIGITETGVSGTGVRFEIKIPNQTYRYEEQIASD